MRYATDREEALPQLLKEEEQLYLLQSQRDSLAASVESPATSNRYRENGNVEKVWGAVYTPPRVTAAMVRWAVRAGSDTVLDPSCGEGVFMPAQLRFFDVT